MKIYSLVRTELNNQTELSHFATMEAAQKQMLEECSQIVGEEITEIHYNYITQDNVWDVTMGYDYATLSNGNKIEFEIFERVIDLKDFVINTIIDNAIEIDANCKNYRKIIYDTINSFGETDLPRMIKTEITHFITTELESAIACRAADVINEKYEDDEIHSIVFDYLIGNRGFSFMAKIINREEPATMELKNEINKSTGRNIFNKDYVWVYRSYWNDGKNFEREEYIKVFKNYDAARMTMESTMEDVIKTFRTCYGESIIKTYNERNLFQVCDEDVHDMWQGTLTKQYIED